MSEPMEPRPEVLEDDDQDNPAQPAAGRDDGDPPDAEAPDLSDRPTVFRPPNPTDLHPH